MDESEVWNSFRKKFGVVGMQETQGETGILRGLMRVFERIQTLEEERQIVKNNVDILDARRYPESSEFHRSLTLAEARCSLLEQQLRSLREFLHSSLLSPVCSHRLPNPSSVKNGTDTAFKASHPKKSPGSSSNFRYDTAEYLRNLSSAASRSTSERAPGHGRQKARQRSPKNESVSSASRSTTLSHYHIKMSDMPFVPAASTTKSHSLRANIQNLHSQLNSHNPNMRRSHRRGRSASADRQHCSRSRQSGRSRGLTRWHSLSDVTNKKARQQSGDSSGTRRSHTGFLTPSNIMADLDTVPVRLENNYYLKNKQSDDACDHPGKVCIKTELRSQPAGCSKTFEVKMTTSAGIPTKLRGRANLEDLQNKRHLLRDLQFLQNAMQKD